VAVQKGRKLTHRTQVVNDLFGDDMFRNSRLAVLVLVVIVRLVPLAAAAPSNDNGPTASPPNIVLIISDDQAWTDFSFMGHSHLKTPNLDRLASESLTFTHGYVPLSLCCPSLASIITGLYPHQHKITGIDPLAPPGMKPIAFRQSAAFQEGREIMNRHLEAMPKYWGMIEWFDQTVGDLLKHLDEQKLSDNTVVIFAKQKTAKNANTHFAGQLALAAMIG
jgi:arylsulfatase A-like enzyme